MNGTFWKERPSGYQDISINSTLQSIHFITNLIIKDASIGLLCAKQQPLITSLWVVTALWMRRLRGRLHDSPYSLCYSILGHSKLERTVSVSLPLPFTPALSVPYFCSIYGPTFQQTHLCKSITHEETAPALSCERRHPLLRALEIDGFLGTSARRAEETQSCMKSKGWGHSGWHSYFSTSKKTHNVPVSKQTPTK